MEILNIIKRKKFWINDFLHRKGMWKDLKEIYFIYNNPEKGEIIRRQKLNDFLAFTTQNVPFYKKRNIFSNNLSDYPVVNKQIYLQNYAEFLTPFELIPGQKGELHIQRTSGSTGTPFELP